ncbi:MAG: hypothetical protein A2Y40_07720 [Candidatus Margulisbacteria bacterium GWF2_35_9]|nr:MAG: hypothetical protein A2Y40_07720 [Candidatus Margulisbacteria bacterium GWF2_35_9]
MKVIDLFNSLLKYKIVIIGITLFSFVFFSMTAYSAKTIYEAEASLLVKQSESQMESALEFSGNKFPTQKEAVITILYSRQLNNHMPKEDHVAVKKSLLEKLMAVRRPFQISTERESNVLVLSYKGYDKELLITNLQNIINAIDPTNEELGFSSVKPLVTVIDQPFIKPVDIKKYRMNYIIINTLAIFFTLIAIIFLAEYVKFERASSVKNK